MNYKNIDVYTLIKPEILKLKNIGIETPNLDCRLLLSNSLDKYVKLYNHQNIYISHDEINRFQDLIQQRLTTFHKSFYWCSRLLDHPQDLSIFHWDL